MLSRSLVLAVALTISASISIISAAISWTRLIQLSLALPLALPALNVLFTLLIAASAASGQFLSHRNRKALISLSRSMSTLALTILFTLSLVYAMPSDMQSCAADRQWLRMFESKNAIAVRKIQSNLHCCGYNSMRDRAWPFPSKDVDVGTCEKTQGYYIACGALWRQEQQFAAVMSATASFLNWLLMVTFHLRIGKKILTSAQVLVAKFTSHDERSVRWPRWKRGTERNRESAVRIDTQEPGQAEENNGASYQPLNADAAVFVPDQSSRT